MIGDSTALGQGADYKDSIAYQSALFLSKKHTVTLVNLGISGVTMREVLQTQADNAAQERADIVLVCAGANDVTHLSRLQTVKDSTSEIIDKIKKAKSTSKVLFTGSPAMGSVARFPLAIKLLAWRRTEHINKAIQEVAAQKEIERLKIAEKTGPLFLQNPKLFARDKFHPNSSGYATWLPVIIKAL